MIARQTLLDYLADYLAIDKFKDYAPNGLQVEGTGELKKIITGVTASEALIDYAIAHQADAIIVHHGYFWRNEAPEVCGMKRNRLKKLLMHDINLIAYHLPLDAHPVMGNNAVLGAQIGLKDITPEEGLLRLGCLASPVSIEQFKQSINALLNRQLLHLPGGPEQIEKVAWCTGGAQNMIDQACAWGADVFISGEVSEQTFHSAAEGKIHYFAAGHHATETWGVKALAEHIREKFLMDCIFVDLPNPV
ncbi:Nif3-like dinuclear metal center hexameric protein [Thiomicrospira sp. ALE5]|uniref:Nif3-like dinuclear metal center hexameric protein n=1 Tax=Thiomicrospira sp. ALE5 TaxID=748650 RepID=UPI0008EE65EF|nr:Nif3-like dinuclear metal center hexameric protein [Thiomicrospira sp. ALE5]SFR59717.1 dinuclear metal center protein, YbgI/SA1388 family [Thiomicrospira sp. ALE5]